MTRIPVGVIGVGALGRHHARHLAASTAARLVGVHDLDHDRGRTVADGVGTRFYADLDELLRAVEAVTIAVPTPVHAAVGLQALDRGRAVLMEKPLAVSIAEADALIAAAAQSGVPLVVGHIERFNRAVRAAGAFLGEIKYFESTRLAPFQPRGTDVAVILDLMILDLDLVLHLTRGDAVADVRASGVAVLTPHVDVANARVEFAGGGVANITASRVARDRVRKLRLFQSNGYLSLDLAAGTGVFMRLRRDRPAGQAVNLEEVVEVVQLEAPEGDALGAELESFVRFLRGDPDLVVTGVEGRAALALALRVRDAVTRR